MTPEQAIEALKRAETLIDRGVDQAGDFAPFHVWELAKNRRAEYKAAIRTLKKHIEAARGK